MSLPDRSRRVVVAGLSALALTLGGAAWASAPASALDVPGTTTGVLDAATGCLVNPVTKAFLAASVQPAGCKLPAAPAPVPPPPPPPAPLPVAVPPVTQPAPPPPAPAPAPASGNTSVTQNKPAPGGSGGGGGGGGSTGASTSTGTGTQQTQPAPPPAAPPAPLVPGVNGGLALTGGSGSASLANYEGFGSFAPYARGMTAGSGFASLPGFGAPMIAPPPSLALPGVKKPQTAPAPAFTPASESAPVAPTGLPILLVLVAGTAVAVAGAAQVAEMKRRRGAVAAG